ncbi:MAG: hypothetical protein JSU00_09400 [Acidobacteria bacterium]|nr:hypothetical protein [Acidobacteriota bacterium]
MAVRGNVHPLARAEHDIGAVAPNRRLDRMVLALRPSADQEAELEALLEAQQDPSSPDFRRWLTPEEFGQRFGVSRNDLRQLVDWLSGQGFEVEPLPAGGRLIVFSGAAEQVEAAFSVRMRRYRIHGEEHIANEGDPRIPEALAAVVGGFVSLNDFRSAPQHVAMASGIVPEYSAGSSHYLSPADYATIYGLTPLFTGSFDGSGQTIAVIGRTNINKSDVASFRSRFGLPAGDPTIVLAGADPGVISGGEQMEATLDVQWAGATAPKAAVKLVVSGSTSSSDGITLSAQYAVNNNVAPIITLSFGLCEASMGRSGSTFWNSLWQQAAAQGQTVLVASGDSGAAGCDSPSSSTAVSGAGVNALCSSPYSTCVGGTQFQDTANPSLFWSSSNASTYGSALAYIPEAAWNETASGGLWATGGGASIFFSKPSWQSAPGVPADGKRDVPDVSLTAAGHDGYLIVMNGSLGVVGGTSAATPALAGILSIVAQKANARLGNANPSFYALATRQASGGASVFHDVVSGTNGVPGVTGFSAGAGYDLATGLGSVDAFQLASHWSEGSTATPGFTLSAAPTSVTAAKGSSGTAAVSVTATGGFSTAVVLTASGAPSGVTASFSNSTVASASGTATLTLAASAQATPGTYPITVTGTGGSTVRTSSVSLVIPQPCTYALDPASASVGAGAATFTVKVTTGAGCAWTASTSTGWITLASASSGSGAGTFSYSVAANTSGATRTGTATIGGQTLTVTQSGASCSYSVSPTAVRAGASPGSYTVQVTAASGCPWTASTATSWIGVSTSTASPSGSGSVAIAVASNTASSSRTGSLSVAGQTVSVTQEAAPTFSLSANSASLPATASTGSVTVTAPSQSTSWTAASNAAWLTITAGASGTGSRTVGFAATANSSSSARTAVISIANLTFNVVQAAAACSFSVTPTAVSATASAASYQLQVTAPAGCAWTATSGSSFLTVASGASGAGAGSVSFVAAANTGAARNGSLTVAGVTVSVSQGAASSSATLSSNSANVGAGASTGSIVVTPANSATAWTARSNVSWIAVATGAAGTGKGTVTFAVAANTASTARTGTLTVAGQTFTVNQAASCSVAIGAASVTPQPTGVLLSLPVNTGAACGWATSSDASWLVVVSGAGTGPGTATLKAAPNTTRTPRTARVVIGNVTLTVSQGA